MQNDAFIIKVLSTANTIGKILLTSGAEAYRVEEAITLVCRRFDLKVRIICYYDLCSYFSKEERWRSYYRS